MAAAQDTKDNCERVRDVGERAVTAGGLHVAEGSIIWDAYRSGSLLKCHAGVNFLLCRISVHCCTKAWGHVMDAT